MIRAPQAFAPRASGPIDALQYEVLQEKAATLSRMVQHFEAALTAFKAAAAQETADAAQREELLEVAGEALWFLVVQRESCGLTNTEAMLRTYDVPLAVRLRMGPARRIKPADREPVSGSGDLPSATRRARK